MSAMAVWGAGQFAHQPLKGTMSRAFAPHDKRGQCAATGKCGRVVGNSQLHIRTGHAVFGLPSVSARHGQYSCVNMTSCLIIKLAAKF